MKYYNKIIQIERFAVLLAGPLLFLFHTSCFKEDSRCITQVGKPKYEEREVSGSFDSIYLDGDINLYLSCGDKPRVYLQAGEKLLPGISTIQKRQSLTITDENKCDFLREMGTPVDVYITLKELKYLNFRSSGKIQSTTPLISDSLTIECWGGGASVNLDIDVLYCWLSQHQGNADFTISGKATHNYIYWLGYSPIDCSKLKTGYTYIIHRGTNNALIYVENALEAEVHSIGDIYYRGAPDIIIFKGFGKGKLKKLL